MNTWQETFNGTMFETGWGEIYVSCNSGQWRFQVFANIGGKLNKSDCRVSEEFPNQEAAKQAGMKEAVRLLEKEISFLQKRIAV